MYRPLWAVTWCYHQMFVVYKIVCFLKLMVVLELFVYIIYTFKFFLFSQKQKQIIFYMTPAVKDWLDFVQKCSITTADLFTKCVIRMCNDSHNSMFQLLSNQNWWNNALIRKRFKTGIIPFLIIFSNYIKIIVLKE